MSASDQHDKPQHDPHSTLPLWTSNTAATRFRILRPHAKGGLGEVYVAEDAELHRHVALKQIQPHHADHPEARSRFLLEAEITGCLEHPGIVPVYGLGAYEDGRPFYAMRFIKGDSLQEATDRFHSAIPNPQSTFDSLPFRKLLQRFIDVCNAIEYAHSRGVLHRDLKPGNIMLGNYGETLVVDWGLAKVTSSPSDETFEEPTRLRPTSASGSAPTQMGAAIGTPAYMSPEQAAGRVDQLGPASDVYSLGATLYYVLTGRAPFGRDDLATTLRKVQAGDFAPPSAIKPGVPRALEAICLKAMSVKALNRYASPRELADDLERWLADEPVTVHREPLAARARRWIRKHPKSVATLAATVVVGLASLAVITFVVTQKNRLLAAAYDSERLAKLEEAKARQRAEGVTQYLVQAFRSPDPKRAGRTILMAEVLDRSVKDLQDQFNEDPLTKATLLDAVGRSYFGLGLYAESIPLFQESRDLRLENLGSGQADVLTTTNNLAAAYEAAGQLDRALPLMEEVLRLRQAKFTEDDSDTLTAMNNLANAYRSAGQLNRALTLHEETLKRRRAKLGPEHRHTLASMNNLAVAYKSAGQFAQALSLQEETLELIKVRLGGEHPETLSAMNNLAEVFGAAGQLDRALPLYEETLALRQTKLGLEHPDTLSSMNNLAVAYNSAGRLDRALPLHEETLKLRQANLGVEHPDTLDSINNLAMGYRSAGKVDRALPLLEQSLQIRQATFAADHPETLTAMNNLASAYVSAGQLDRALPLHEETLKLRRAKLGPKHPDTLASMNNLALAYLSARQLDRALPLLEETLELSKALLGEDHPRTLTSMDNLAGALRAVGQLDRAVPLYEETLRLRKAKLPPYHPDTLLTTFNLIDPYLSSKQYDQALAMVEGLVDGERHRTANDRRRFANILTMVSLALLDHGQFSGAEPYLREGLAIREQIMADDWMVFNTRSLLGAALAGQKKLDEAETWLIEGYEGMKQREDQIPEVGKPRLTEALQRLVDLNTAWDKPEPAARWQKELDRRKETKNDAKPSGDSR